MSESQDIAARAAAFDKDASSPRGGKVVQALALTVALGGTGAAAVYYLAQPKDEALPNVAVAQPDEFQAREDDGTGIGFLDAPAQRENPAPVDTGPSPREMALERELTALRDQLSERQQQAATQAEPAASTDPQMLALIDKIDAFSEDLSTSQVEMAAFRQEAANREAEFERALEAAKREQARLESQLALAEAQARVQPAAVQTTATNARDDYSVTAEEQAAIEAAEQRRAALEAERQRIAEFEQARRSSGLIAFGGGGGEASPMDEVTLSEDASFVRSVAQPAAVTRAKVIANPSNTVVQGTMIAGVMETAIDTTLQGPARAVVSEDVWSFDGSRVLIPRGSKIIGQYSSGVSAGQNRALVAWTRVIMPDNQTVELAAFGTDHIGRTGLAGQVDRHFLERFGGATLISIIGAAPVLAAQSQDDELSRDVAEDVGNDLSNATGQAISEIVAIPPTILVQAGTRMTVFVNSDLEIY